MGNYARIFFFIAGFISPFFVKAQSANFSIPDTVCISEPVNIINHSTGATSYYWSFCVANILNTPPLGTNIGNPGGFLHFPVFADFVEENGNFYVFVVNNDIGTLIRLDFGNSLLNTPNAVNLGNLGGLLKIHTEGIQVVKEDGNWYAFIVGGDKDLGDVPQIIKIEFGNNINNNTPAVTDWGNIGNMNQPLDLFLFKDNADWYGFTVDKDGNVIRFNFGSNFNNPPNFTKYTNLELVYPTGINVITENGQWYVFVTTANDNGLTRLDFGNSLLNTPVGIHLGNPNNVLKSPRDIYILRFCDAIVGFVVNGVGQDLIRLDFKNNLVSAPSGVSLGNIGNFSFPHSLSKLFRVNDKVYTFITNVDNNTITRLEFPSCTNSSLPSFNLQTPPPISYDAPGVYNINLTIDDGLPTQSSFCRQVVVVPKPVHKPIQTFTISPGDDIKIGTDDPSGTYLWNTGKITDSIIVRDEGIYWVETSGYGCSNRDSFLLRYAIIADFTYKQDVCNPLLFEFKNETTGSTVINWDFGNGPAASGETNPSITYTGFGNYDVILKLEIFGGDIVSVAKQITVQVVIDSLVITNNATICEGDSLQLNAVQALNYCWSPAFGLSTTTIANPVATPLATTTYYLHTLVNGANLIVNGDFSAGNTGFISEYALANPNTLDGQFFVGSNPKAWNPSVSNCTDHASGSGNMLLVNGSPDDNVKVWTQTINVTPNTNYAFSTWIQALYHDNPAELQFFINGNNVGNLITASLPTCTWNQFYTTWNSGNNTVATIAIVNKNTEILIWGNDFALDDIVFAAVTIKRDSIVITVEKKPDVRANSDTLICEGGSVQLNATGAATYSWTPDTGLSGTNIQNPQAKPGNTTDYIVTGNTPAGCKGKDTVVITVNPKPIVSIRGDTSICANTSIQLKAEGGVGYMWWPATTLDNPGVFNPTATPYQNTTYAVQVTDANNCTNTDSVEVRIRPYPQFTVSNDTSICEGTNGVVLQSQGGDSYQWSPEISLDDYLSSSPVASPASTTQYAVQINDVHCGHDTTMQTTVTVNPSPVVTAVKSNDINCTVRTAQLLAGGTESYIWSPGIYLDDMNRANPVATLESTTTFVVTGTSEHGCSASDSVTVKVTADGKGLFLVPNAFTPNGDGLNDCFGISQWGNVQLKDFSIYNRWGERIFKAANASDCWDGTYQGKPQDTGAFVYVIDVDTHCGAVSRKGLITIIR